MGQLEEEVYRLIVEQYQSVPKLSEHIGVPQQTIYSALRSRLLGASAATVLPIASALQLDPFQLLEGRVVTAEETASAPVPLYGNIAAGQPIEPDTAEFFFPVPLKVHNQYPDAFLLRIEGESMNRVLPNGCYALVDPCCEILTSGQLFALVVGETGATVKRVRLLANGIELQPDSDDPTFKPLVFDYSDPEAKSVSVIGRVVWYSVPPSWGQTA